jgi:hypothetical protein
MRKFSLFIIAAWIASGCSSSAPVHPNLDSKASAPPKVSDDYSREENKWLTYCVALTDTSWSIASQKLSGVDRETVRAYYATKTKEQSAKQNMELYNAAIEKTYAEPFSNSWDYSVSFFRECALNMAQVKAERSNLAAYCMQNAMLAELAHGAKEAGETKEKAYAASPLKGNSPKAVYDNVYAKNQTRVDAMLGAWNACMAPITATR